MLNSVSGKLSNAISFDNAITTKISASLHSNAKNYLHARECVKLNPIRNN